MQLGRMAVITDRPRVDRVGVVAKEKAHIVSFIFEDLELCGGECLWPV